jgi:hypothetical protein
MPESDKNQLTQDSEASGASTPLKAETTSQLPPRRKSHAFRQELLSRLPMLGVSKWQPTETLNVYQDLQGIVDLSADAFLEPLEPIAEERHE